MRRVLAIGLTLLATEIGVPTALAKFITIETSVSVAMDGATARTLVNVSNKGDEPAHHVRVRAEIDGAVQTGPVREALSPGEQHAEAFNTAVGYRKPGRYPVIITVDYADGNQYPFSALSVVHLTYQDDVPGRVVGEIGSVTIDSNGSLPLKIRNLGSTEERVSVRLITPGELSASPSTREVRIKPSGEDSLTFKVRNASALPGSQYQVYAVLNYEQDDYHFSNVVGGQISVEQGRPPFAASPAPLIAVAILVAGALVYVNLRKRPREHPAL